MSCYTKLLFIVLVATFVYVIVNNPCLIKSLRNSTGYPTYLDVDNVDYRDILNISPFVPYRETFVTANNHNVAACRIQKNLSTVLWSIFCFLNNPELYESGNASLVAASGDIFQYRICNSTEVVGLRKVRKSSKIIAVIRDPLERFLSAFVDKCIVEAKEHKSRCYQCKGDMLCLVRRQFSRLLKISEGVLFTYTYEDRHFAPMSWYCGFSKDTMGSFDFITYKEGSEQFDTLAEVLAALDKNGVPPDSISFLRGELQGNRTSHATSGTLIRDFYNTKMRSNRMVMSLLRKMYASDYEIFGLGEFPQ